MKHRVLLASELLMTGLVKFYDDYRKISNSLECGFSREFILAMPELARWPEACQWLKERL
jgi:hypothetical protein